MNAIVEKPASTFQLQPENARLDYLDATRAFALVLGVVFHAALSFMPIFVGWAVVDISTSPLVGMFFTVSHSFRMEIFFLLAGFFARASFHRKGAVEFMRTRLEQIVVPFVAGWFLLRPLLVSGWIMGGASLRGDYDFWAGIQGGWQSLASLPAGLFTGSHLWFLYYLAMITALALALRALLGAAGESHRRMVNQADRFVAWFANSWGALPIAVVPTAALLWSASDFGWGMPTPDQSLKPHGPVLSIYGGFFGLGWLLNRQRELVSQLARLSVGRWMTATVGIAGTLLLTGIERDAGHPHRAAAHLGYALSYALMMWSLVFLTLGVFKRFGERRRPWVRYVADASYWLYLVHLPIVVWLQVAVAEWPLHWSVKLAGISAGTIAVSLLSYDLFVRSTWVGWLLNGRRRERVIARFVFRSSAVRNAGERVGP